MKMMHGAFEHVADAARAHADEHFDEVGAGDAEERYLGLAGDGAGDEGLAGSGRADEEYALGDAAAELLELLGVAQEVDDFLDFLAGLVHAGNVLEGDLVRVAAHQARARLAEGEGPAVAGRHVAVEEEIDEREHDQQRHRAGKDVPQHRVLRLERERHPRVRQLPDQVFGDGGDDPEGLRLPLLDVDVLELAADDALSREIRRQFARRDAPALDQREEVRIVRDGLLLAAVLRDDLEQADRQRHEEQPNEHRARHGGRPVLGFLAVRGGILVLVRFHVFSVG